MLQALKNLKKAQKEQLNLTFSEDLTAVSLVWTIFQTKPTTNDYSYYTLFSQIFQGFFYYLYAVEFFRMPKFIHFLGERHRVLKKD